MTNLTQDWKDGKLKEGFYYVYLKHLRLFDIATSSTLFGILERGNENCLEVLAPVPSYEEWQELKEASDGLSNLMSKSLMNRFVKADEEREKLAEENQQLKKLLKECKRYIDFWGYTDSHGNFLYPQIDNAIGEKK